MSSREFIKFNRKCLEEGEGVCENLPKWIDLVFGVNSRGTGAEKTDNVFAESSYFLPGEGEESGDNNINDNDNDTNVLESEVREFGVVPSQVFFGSFPHPGKLEFEPEDDKHHDWRDFLVDKSNVGGRGRGKFRSRRSSTNYEEISKLEGDIRKSVDRTRGSAEEKILGGSVPKMSLHGHFMNMGGGGNDVFG